MPETSCRRLFALSCPMREILVPGSHAGDGLLGVQQVAAMLALAATAAR